MSANGAPVAAVAAPPPPPSPTLRPCSPPRPLIVAFDLDATIWTPEMYELWGGAPFKRDPKTGRVEDRNGERLSLMGHAAHVLEMLAAARSSSGGRGGGRAAQDGGDGHGDGEGEEDKDEEDEEEDPVLSARGWEMTEVAYVSRTEHADWAEDALRAFAFPLLPDGGPPPPSPLSPRAQKKRDRAREQRRAARSPRRGHHDVPHLHALAAHREIYPGSKVAHFRRIKERAAAGGGGVDYGDMLFFDNERGNVVEVERLGVVSVYCPRGLTREAWEEGLRKFAACKAAAAGVRLKNSK